MGMTLVAITRVMLRMTTITWRMMDIGSLHVSRVPTARIAEVSTPLLTTLVPPIPTVALRLALTHAHTLAMASATILAEPIIASLERIARTVALLVPTILLVAMTTVGGMTTTTTGPSTTATFSIRPRGSRPTVTV